MPHSTIQTDTKQQEELPIYEDVQIVLRGSIKGVNAVIHQLHCAGFIAVGHWCQPQPILNIEGNEFISLTHKKFRCQQAAKKS